MIDKAKFYDKQLDLIHEFSLMFLFKTYEPGKTLMAFTFIINKITRILSEIADIVYEFKLRYYIVRSIYSYISGSQSLPVVLQVLNEIPLNLNGLLKHFTDIIPSPGEEN